jgi:hypothetical protein
MELVATSELGTTITISNIERVITMVLMAALMV